MSGTIPQALHTYPIMVVTTVELVGIAKNIKIYIHVLFSYLRVTTKGNLAYTRK